MNKNYLQKNQYVLVSFSYYYKNFEFTLSFIHTRLDSNLCNILSHIKDEFYIQFDFMNVIRTRFLTMTQNLNKIVLVIMLLMLLF